MTIIGIYSSGWTSSDSLISSSEEIPGDRLSSLNCVTISLGAVVWNSMALLAGPGFAVASDADSSAKK